MTLREVDIKSEEMEANEDTIRILEQYLEDAKKGLITEVIMVGTNPTTKIVKMSCSQTLSVMNQLGALALAKANVLSHVIVDRHIDD